jgi:hypothetical protein
MVFVKNALFLVLLAVSFAAPVQAQSVVTSPGPDAVSITIYRDPNRDLGGDIDLDALSGFALITETRTVTVPAGDSVIRFEGVSAGIVPVSAIVTGLPGGVVQKNRDANLLSPSALVDGSYGRIVRLKRTNRKTGAVTVEDAEIIAGPQKGILLRTKRGVEALGCSGLPESIDYRSVPSGLSAKPTLSVTTRSPQAASVTVRLSYLSTGFDWSAAYVARINADGKTLNLFAWMTLANSNAQNFVNAEIQTLAGTVNRDEDGADPTLEDAVEEAEPLKLQCWPLDGTSTANQHYRSDVPIETSSFGSDIIVTARRRSESLQDSPAAITATSENFGDLKLFRVPERMTVAANAQKQVALMDKRNVPFEQSYVGRISSYTAMEDQPAAEADAPAIRPMLMIFRMKNTAKGGLGLALPVGTARLFVERSAGDLLVGDGAMRDYALNEEIEWGVAVSNQVHEVQGRIAGKPPGHGYVDLSNANPFPIVAEIYVPYANDGAIIKASAHLGKRKGIGYWRAKVPANGRTRLTYAFKPAAEAEER